MTVDITTATLVLVYAGMAGYIVYLQHRVRKAASDMRISIEIIRGLITGKISVEEIDDGFRIKRNPASVS